MTDTFTPPPAGPAVLPGRRLLGRQRSNVTVGKIRIGETQPTASGTGTRPVKLTTFKFTSPNRRVIESVALAYGGNVAPYEPARGVKGWGVVTEATAIGVMVALGTKVIEQSYELWGGGGAERRCDGRYDERNPASAQFNGYAPAPGTCRCPKKLQGNQPITDVEGYYVVDDDRRKAASKAKKPTACKPHTRLWVRLPDVDTLGVWQYESSGEVVADEMADIAYQLAEWAARGNVVPAELSLTWREKNNPGEDKQIFPVVVLDTIHGIRALATGALNSSGNAAAALPPPPPRVAALALTAGPSAQQPAGPATPPPPPAPPQTAKDAAAQAQAMTSHSAVGDLMVALKDDPMLDDEVWVPVPGGHPDQEQPMSLVEYLRVRFLELRPAPAPTDQTDTVQGDPQ